MRNFKNALLWVCALALACCVAILILTATNTKALEKFNHYIVYISKQVSTKSLNFSNSAFAKTDDVLPPHAQKDQPQQSTHYTPIASTMSEEDVKDKIDDATLADFDDALKTAQREVNKHNQRNNPYNDYGYHCDANARGDYKYIFSFENAAEPHTYYRVTVDKDLNVHIIDSDYQSKNQNRSTTPKVSRQESEVIAKSYMASHKGGDYQVKGTNYSNEGVKYTFTLQDKQVAVMVTHQGQVIPQ